jgi:Cu2+-exporting ATPase
LPEIDEAAYRVGFGLTVEVDQATVRVGSKRFIEESGLSWPAAALETEEASHARGNSLTIVAVDSRVIGAIELEPTVRPEARTVVADLKGRGVETYIISGDDEAPTRRLAHELGIDHYYAQTLPEGKADIIDRLQCDGRIVCYVGDGINDAIALKKAAVSVSLKGASTVAVDTAQVILVDEDLSHLSALLDLAAGFNRNMRRTFCCVVVPHLLSFLGILFLNVGILPVIIVCQTGLMVGIGNSLLPRLQHEKDNRDV